MMIKSTVTTFILVFATLGITGDSMAIEHKMRELDQKNLIQKKYWPSRLGNSQERKCAACEEREAKARTEYLTRVLSDKDQGQYQAQVRELLLQDSKFAKSCWDRLTPKGVEFFFTVNTDGEAEDIASFPKKTMTRCLKRHVKKMAFPEPEENRHIWLVVSAR